MLMYFCSTILCIRNIFFYICAKLTSNTVTDNRIANNVGRHCNYIFIVVSGREFYHACSYIW